MTPGEAVRSSAVSRILPAVAFVLCVAALYAAREVLVPFALAVLLAFLLSPIVRKLEGGFVSRGPAVAIVVLIFLALSAAIGWIVTNQLIGVVTQLPSYSRNIQTKISGIQGPNGGALHKVTDSIRELNQYLTPNPAERAASPAHPVPVELVDRPPGTLENLRQMLGPLAAPFATTLIVIVFTIFMLMRREDLRNRLVSLVERRQLHTVTLLIDDAAQRVSRYLVMECSINAAFAAVITAGLHLLGLPNALLWGVLAGMLRFIPYVGPMIGGSLPFLLAVVVFDGWTRPLLVLGFFLLCEFATSNFVEPSLGASRTGISPLAILVAAIFWGALWGPAGLVLSTPLTVCLVVLGRYVPQLEFLYVLLGDEPALSPEAHFYQRLLALDQHEAQTVADAFLKSRSLVELHDSVILPALSMAEQDRHNGSLDATKAAFIIQSVGEIVGLVSEPDDPPLGQTALRVLIVPVTDEADTVTGAMLSQLAGQAGFPAICLPPAESVPEMLMTVAKIARPTDDILCIAAMPPFALLKARTLSRQLQSRFPDLPLIVCLWSRQSDENTVERFGKAFSTPVATNFVDAVSLIQTAAQTLHTDRGSQSQMPDPVPAGVATDVQRVGEGGNNGNQS